MHFNVSQRFFLPVRLRTFLIAFSSCCKSVVELLIDRNKLLGWKLNISNHDDKRIYLHVADSDDLVSQFQWIIE